MVMESHYLESLERESSPSLSDMERQDYIDQINDLKATIKRLLDMTDTLKQTLDSVTASNKRNGKADSSDRSASEDDKESGG